jgi:hypothetical protein
MPVSMLKVTKIGSALLALSLSACTTTTDVSYIPITDNPADLDYAIEVCRAEADASGYAVKSGVAAATTDITGAGGAAGGFAAGFANSMQGSSEGRTAERKYFRACMARAGYKIE